MALESTLASGRDWLWALIKSSPSFSLDLSILSRPLKYLVLLLLIINVRSFPLAWHVRAWFPAYAWRFRAPFYGGNKKYLKITSPIGKSPFEIVHVMQGFASPDDCDAFGHLSNSSYAKTLDIARFQWCMKAVVAWFGEKGFMALGGAHYAFLKEIPFLSPYEVRIGLGGWDRKWIYLISYFITYPKMRKGSKSKENGSLSRLELPSPLSPALLPEGATLHCVSVSRYCMKLQRLTVPPAVAMSLSGMGSTPAIGQARWDRKEALRAEGKLDAVIRGAWAEELARPTEDGGWGLEEFEDARKKGMEVCSLLAAGMDGLKPVVST